MEEPERLQVRIPQQPDGTYGFEIGRGALNNSESTESATRSSKTQKRGSEVTRCAWLPWRKKKNNKNNRETLCNPIVVTEVRDSGGSEVAVQENDVIDALNGKNAAVLSNAQINEILNKKAEYLDVVLLRGRTTDGDKHTKVQQEQQQQEQQQHLEEPQQLATHRYGHGSSSSYRQPEQQSQLSSKNKDHIVHASNLRHDKNDEAMRACKTFSHHRSVRLFISSCFLDMRGERDALMKHAFPPLRNLCASKGLSFTEVDMRWGITAETEGSDVITTCLREVYDSNILICLVGQRYGWIPSVTELKEACSQLGTEYSWLASDGRDKSMTHLEMYDGVLRHSKEECKSPRRAFVYFRDPHYAESTDPTVFQSESQEAMARLEQLKKDLQDCEFATCRTYESPQDIATMVQTDVSDHLKSTYTDQLVPQTPLEKERFDHLMFAESRSRLFVPFANLSPIVTRGTAKQPSSPVAIIGPSGCGKSALMAHMYDIIEQQQSENLFGLVHFIGHSSHSAQYVNLLRRIMSELKVWSKNDKEEIPDDPEKLAKAFPAWLGMAASARPDSHIFLFLDALNQLQDVDQARKLGWLPQAYPENVHVIVTCTPGICESVLAERGWDILRVPEITRDGKMKLATRYLAEYGKQLEESRLSKLVDAPQTSNPLYLKLLIDELRMVGEFDRLDDQISRLLTAKDVVSLYTAVLGRLEATYNSRLQQPNEEHKNPDVCKGGIVGTMMVFILASRNGMSENELVEALKIPRAKLSPLFHAVQESLVSHTGLLMFYHQALENSVIGRYIGDEKDMIAIHRSLADFFQDMDSSDSRRYQELPWHLFQCGDQEALATLLSDMTCFEQMASSEFSRLELGQYWRALGLEKSGKYYVEGLKKYLSANVEKFSRAQLARTVLNVGGLLHQWAQYKDAENVYSWALVIARTDTSVTPASLFGAKAPEGAKVSDPMPVVETVIAEALENKAKVFIHCSKSKEAMDLLQEARVIRERINGSSSDEATRILDELGWVKICFRELRGSWGAVDLLKRSISKKTVAMRLRKNLADPPLDLEIDVDETRWMDCLQAAVDECANSADDLNFSGLSIAINRLAVAYSNLEKFNLAEALFKFSRRLHETIWGPEHYSLATVCADIGNLYLRRVKKIQAQQENNDSTDAEEEMEEPYLYSQPSNTNEQQKSVNDIANDTERLLSAAKEMFLRSMRIREKALGKLHPFYATSLCYYGDYLQTKGDVSGALKCYEEVVQIRTNVFGDSSNKQVKAAKGRVTKLKKRYPDL